MISWENRQETTIQSRPDRSGLDPRTRHAAIRLASLAEPSRNHRFRFTPRFLRSIPITTLNFVLQVPLKITEQSKITHTHKICSFLREHIDIDFIFNTCNYMYAAYPTFQAGTLIPWEVEGVRMTVVVRSFALDSQCPGLETSNTARSC